MKLSSSAEQEVFQSVKRTCYAGLDSVALRTEVARRIARALPMEAHAFSTTDPDTGLLTHSVAEGMTFDLVRTYLCTFYPDEEAMKTLDLARSGAVVSTENSDAYWAMVAEAGVEHELHTVFCADGALWGSWCMMREFGAPGFSEREKALMRRIAPHVARGLKVAALIDATAARPDPLQTPDGETTGVSAPGVIVLDAHARIALRTSAAEAQLGDLADRGMERSDLPFALASVFVRLREQHARSVMQEGSSLSAELHVRGRSGCWYTLRASLAEPNASGESTTVVVIEPASGRETAPILARLYGLSPREREVVALVAYGESTKRIAARLGVSVHTAQEHLDRACEKVGARGRKALLAKLFFDGYAPRLMG